MFEPIGIHTMTTRRFGKSTRVQGLNPPPQFATLPIAEDVFIYSQIPNTNNEGDTGINTSITPLIHRSFVKPDFSSLPAGSKIVLASLFLTTRTSIAFGSTDILGYRPLRDIVYGQVTWNIWKTSNNWATAGCGDSTNDYDGSKLLGTVPVFPVASDTLFEMVLDPDEIQKMNAGTYSNDGIFLLANSLTSSTISWHSIEATTPAFRPYMEVYYR